MITRRMEADLRHHGFSQEQINRMTPSEAWELLRAVFSETTPPGHLSDASNPTAKDSPGTSHFETEARRIATELERLHRDGAISRKSSNDKDASFYANLLHTFNATYIGLTRSTPS
jgi:hypothetical protein